MAKKQEAMCSECGWTSKEAVGLSHCPDCKAELIFMEKGEEDNKNEKYSGEEVKKAQEEEALEEV